MMMGICCVKVANIADVDLWPDAHHACEPCPPSIPSTSLESHGLMVVKQRDETELGLPALWFSLAAFFPLGRCLRLTQRGSWSCIAQKMVDRLVRDIRPCVRDVDELGALLLIPWCIVAMIIPPGPLS